MILAHNQLAKCQECKKFEDLNRNLKIPKIEKENLEKSSYLVFNLFRGVEIFKSLRRLG
jgi:hypothetical protein